MAGRALDEPPLCMGGPPIRTALSARDALIEALEADNERLRDMLAVLCVLIQASESLAEARALSARYAESAC